MAWTPPFSYSIYSQASLVKRYRNNEWIQNKLNLINKIDYNKERYKEAKPNVTITFLSYFDKINNTKIEEMYFQHEKIKIARDIIDDADRKSTKYLTVIATIGSLHSNDRIIKDGNEYDLAEIHSMRKKDWEYCLIVTD